MCQKNIVMEPIKYIAQNLSDERWGLMVSTVGFQSVKPGEQYPPALHNREYMFRPERGRVLQEYQLVYIVEGEGELETSSSGRHAVRAGDMFLLFPGEWHTYAPDSATGWSEYWIGFRGANIDHRVREGFFSIDKPMYQIGINQTIIALYKEAIEQATRQEPFFQQLLAGMVNHLLGLMFMTSRNNSMQTHGVMPDIVARARVYMQEAVERDITMPDVAAYLNISYSTFRHIFKRYTGMAPAQYFINLRLFRAKELLRGSTISIKEISYKLCFESPEYFSTLFKSRTGMSPSEFRHA